MRPVVDIKARGGLTGGDVGYFVVETCRWVGQESATLVFRPSRREHVKHRKIVRLS